MLRTFHGSCLQRWLLERGPLQASKCSPERGRPTTTRSTFRFSERRFNAKKSTTQAMPSRSTSWSVSFAFRRQGYLLLLLCTLTCFLLTMRVKPCWLGWISEPRTGHWSRLSSDGSARHRQQQDEAGFRLSASVSGSCHIYTFISWLFLLFIATTTKVLFCEEFSVLVRIFLNQATSSFLRLLLSFWILRRRPVDVLPLAYRLKKMIKYQLWTSAFWRT